MKPSDFFGIVVRVCGLLIALRGLWYLAWVVFVRIGVVEQDPFDKGEIMDYFVGGVAYLAAGAGLLRGASLVVRFTYPTGDAPNPTEVTNR